MKCPKATVVMNDEDGDFDIHLGEPDLLNYSTMVARSESEFSANAIATWLNKWFEANWVEG